MSDKRKPDEREREKSDTPPMDNPEQFKTDNKTIHEMFEEEETVDTLPLEDLKQEQREEDEGRVTKSDSSSEEKYPGF